MTHGIESVVENHLCVGCGLCTCICSADAVEIQRDDRHGVYSAIVKSELCISCGKCLSICPGKEVDLESLSRRHISQNVTSDAVGGYIKCYFSKATNERIRYHSSSGGVVTALLIYAFQTGVIDGAVVTRMHKNNPLETETILARSLNEISNAYGSKYCPTTIGSAIRDIQRTPGRYAIVCLPCQMHGIRKLEDQTPLLKERIVLHLGLFCGHNNSFLALDYFLHKKGISPESIKQMIFRDEGWPGKMVVESIDGMVQRFLRVRNEPSLQRRLLFSSAFHRDFYIPRCLLCPDLTNELADISFGDAWHPRVMATDTTGTSIIITRSIRGNELCASALNEGVLTVEPIDRKTVRQSQKPLYTENVGSRLLLARILGRETPVFTGKKMTANFIGFLRYCRLTPYFMHHRFLWIFWHVFDIPRHWVRILLRLLIGRI